MGPSFRAGLRRAVVAALIAPSVVGAVAIFGASSGTGLIVSGLTLGAVTAVVWSARGGRIVAAACLVVIAGLGALMTFAIGLGWADSAGPFEQRAYDALNLPFAAFAIAIPASIVLTVIQVLRRDDGAKRLSRPGILMPVGILAVPLTAATYVGYRSTFPWTASGGLDGLGRVLVRDPGLAGLIALGIVAIAVIVARARQGARDGRWVRLALGGAGLAGFGALGGLFLTPILGLPYGTPVLAFGSTSARFDGQPTYVPDVSGYTECKSVAGTAVSSVWAEVGSLQSEERQALLFFRAEGPDLFLSRPGGTYSRSEVTFFKNMRGYIARRATILGIETSDAGRSGRVTFRLRGALGETDGHWPAELVGELSWACGTWLGPAASELARDGRIDLRIAGVDWVPNSAPATCELEGAGSVRVVSAYGVGLLQGRNISVHVDLEAQHQAGSVVLASIILAGMDTSDAQVPWWQARVRLAEVTDGDRAGRATFTGMPSAVDPSGAPVSPGWPDTLSGEFSWSCG